MLSSHLKMAKDGRFNFKLLVPPRVNNCSQVSAVKPQESVENRVELGPSKYFVTDQNTPALSKSAVAPTKPITQDCLKMTVAPTERVESDCAPGQLCSKMFDEVEKIKCWKVKVDSDAAQSERKLQENKRTIETQRKAIQELQFQNESLKNVSGPSKYFVTDQNTPALSKSAVAPTKPITQDCLKMTVAPTERVESDCAPGQLCSKMFDEVEKIKCWKVKVDSDAAQSERKLQENKRTIETQRKAIQELQFQNESLSIKLEDQMSENEDWRNKHNATRNLCNLLKETFERSADKMQLFESERDETHHLLMENSERVQKLIVAFEHLRGQAEANDNEMHSVKANLQKLEELKENYQQECTLKENTVATLEAKLQEKVGELEEVQRDLHDTQNQCRLLQEATTQQCEELTSSKMEKESLLEKLHSAEQRCKESETKVHELEEKLFSEMKKAEECSFEIVQLKTELTQNQAKYEELLSNFNEVNFEKKALELKFESTSSNMKAITATMKKLIVAFEHLRGQAEANDNEMHSVKANLQKLEELKENYQQECTLKENTVATLEAKLQEKVGELEEVQRDLHDTQNQCRLLQEATTQQCEELTSSKMEKESLLEKLHSAEQRCKESETRQEAMDVVLRQSKEEHEQILSSKDLSLKEACRVKNELAETLEQVQRTLVELQNSLAFEERRSKDCEEKLMEKNKELERSLQVVGELEEQRARKDEQITILQSELEKSLSLIELVKGKADVLEVRVNDLQDELSAKTIEAQRVMCEAETIRVDNEKLKKAGEKAEKYFLEKQRNSETKVHELEEKLFSEMKKAEECSFEIVQLKTELTQNQAKYEELLSNFNEVNFEKKALELKFESTSSNMKAITATMKGSEEKAVKVAKEIQKLEEENQRLRAEVHTIQSLTQRQYAEIEMLQKKIEDNCQHLQEKVVQTEGQIKAAEVKCSYLMKKIGAHRKAGEYQKEIKKLKTQMAKELVKYNELENKMTSLYDESNNQKRQLEEKHQKLVEELHDKSSFAADLDNKIKELRLTAAEAIKSKEDAEHKCQHKTADIVALMEKHKNQYDRMVKEKDTELDEMRKRETEAISCRVALEIDVSKFKTENGQLKKQLITVKDNFQKELSDLKKELSSLKLSRLSQDKSNTANPFNTHHKGRHAETPRSRSSKMNVFDFAQECDFGSMRMSGEKNPKIKEHQDSASPVNGTKQAGRAEKIKTYRIRTPPSADKPGSWRKRALELEPKSDSSDPNNVLTFKNTPAPHFSVSLSQCNRSKKSPTALKSPGTSLKLAGIKRMRDAGWIAVSDSEKKKKKAQGKIFA
ncbi:synaptonemal complex protein 1 [Hippocampus comes]|uniref:synaptonemal complex protein 1 n=1 Tax=Hippocampus comes TaxID=109280 RepID=UPI00094E54C7|nr:PREDICTED: synaptonemal complex protein 1-like [Hippocampus comes]